MQCGAAQVSRCPQCGTETPPQARFCMECGTAVGGAAAPSALPEVGPTAPPPTSRAPAAPLPPADHPSPAPSAQGSVATTTADDFRAERRQLTVMFCDLVGSTAVSPRLDPEDLHLVLRAYQEACARVIQRYEGYVAKYLGDGLLVYFGYPQAHEDEPHRAVRAGLGIIDAIGRVADRVLKQHGVPLAARIGIHTGLVVVGEVGGEGQRSMDIVGETPNVAARLQGLADPNTVVLTEATHRLVVGYFDCQALGPHALKGLSDPIQVYQALHQSTARSRLEAAATTGALTRWWSGKQSCVSCLNGGGRRRPAAARLCYSAARRAWGNPDWRKR